MTVAAELLVKVGADVSSAQRDLNGFGNRLSGIASGMQRTGLAMTAGITVPITAMGLASINAASDLEESMNKVDVVFGDSATQIQTWAETSAEAFGLSQQQALEAVGTFGNLFDAMGLSDAATADMSQGLIQLAADLASFNNIPVDVALEKLRAGLVGEVEPLRTLGVNLSAAEVKAYAMANGLARTTDELTPAILAQARYALIMEQTTNAQGDFARTSDGLANSTRIAKAQLADAAATLGRQLLPIALQVVRVVSRLVDWFTNLPEPVQRIILVVGALAAAIGPLLMALGSIISAVTTLGPLFAGLASGIGGALAAVAGAVGAALGPVLIIIAAVAAAVLAFKLAWDSNFLGMRDTLQAVWAAIQPIFGAIRQIVADVMAFIRGEITFADLTERVAAQLQIMWQAIVNAFTIIRDWLAGIWEQIKLVIFNALVSIVESMGFSHSQAVAMVTQAWQTISDLISAAWEYIKATILPALLVIQTALEAAWILISELTRATWEEIKLIIETIILALKTVIVATLQALSGDWEGAWNTMKTGAIQIVTNIKDGVLDILGGLVSGVYERGRALAERFGQGILDALNAAFEAARRVAQAIRDLLPGSDAKVGPLSDLGKSGRAFSERFAEGIRLGAMEAVNAANDLAEKINPTTRPFEIYMPPKDYMPPKLHPTRPFEPYKPPMDPYMPPKPTDGGTGGGQCITITINNPTGQPSEESIMRVLKQLAAVGVLRPV